MEQLISQALSDNEAYENIHVTVFENKSGRGMTGSNFTVQQYLDAFTHDGPWLKILREDLPAQCFIEDWPFNKTHDAIVVNPV